MATNVKSMRGWNSRGQFIGVDVLERPRLNGASHWDDDPDRPGSHHRLTRLGFGPHTFA